MPPTQPQENGLYILLFPRSDPPIPDDFHWALYHHHSHVSGGKKYHITGRPGAWLASHETTQGVLKSSLLVGLFQIGTLPAGAETYFDGQMRQFDGVLNEDLGVTCRVWLFRVLGTLLGGPVDGGGGKFLFDADDLEKMEREVKDFGNLYALDAVYNKQPRPVVRSGRLEEVVAGEEL